MHKFCLKVLCLCFVVCCAVFSFRSVSYAEKIDYELEEQQLQRDKERMNDILWYIVIANPTALEDERWFANKYFEPIFYKPLGDPAFNIRYNYYDALVALKKEDPLQFIIAINNDIALHWINIKLILSFFSAVTLTQEELALYTGTVIHAQFRMKIPVKDWRFFTKNTLRMFKIVENTSNKEYLVGVLENLHETGHDFWYFIKKEIVDNKEELSTELLAKSLEMPETPKDPQIREKFFYHVADIIDKFIISQEISASGKGLVLEDWLFLQEVTKRCAVYRLLSQQEIEIQLLGGSQIRLDASATPFLFTYVYSLALMRSGAVQPSKTWQFESVLKTMHNNMHSVPLQRSPSGFTAYVKSMFRDDWFIKVPETFEGRVIDPQAVAAGIVIAEQTIDWNIVRFGLSTEKVPSSLNDKYWFYIGEGYYRLFYFDEAVKEYCELFTTEGDRRIVLHLLDAEAIGKEALAAEKK